MSIDQIEELAWVLCDIPKHPSIKSCEQCGNKHCHAIYYAERAINAGYRKQSAVIDEFSKRLKESPIKCGLPLFGLSTKEEIEEYFNGIMLQVREAIDSIAEEIKGGAE